MKPIYLNWPVYVGWSTRLNCRGMLASRFIKNGELVEACPVVIIEYKNKTERTTGDPTKTLIDHYYYEWDAKHWCLPLGYAMLYNHAYQPNLINRYDYKNKLLLYIARKDINKDDELTVHYNGKPDDTTPIDDWFQEPSGKKMI